MKTTTMTKTKKNIIIMKIFKKLMPFTKTEEDKPLHSGEIYHLWEGLSSGYKLNQLVETYIMNTEDTELHVLLQGLIKGTYLLRIDKLEKVIKEEGFTVPPRPSSKTLQGKPGIGQEVKLTDDEVLLNLSTWGQVLLQNNAAAIGVCTRESVRKIFTDLIFNEMKGYNLIFEMGKRRNVFSPSPPATAKDNSLSMGEVYYLWDELGARHLSLINMETYLANSNDKDVIKLLQRGIKDKIIPQIQTVENILKNEGFTVPPRPPQRLNQGPPGQVNKIKLSDDEIIGTLTTAFQIAIKFHIRGFVSVLISSPTGVIIY